MSSSEVLEENVVEHHIDSDDELDDEDDWNEDEVDQEPTKCLFCDTIDESIEKAIEHLEHQHHITLSYLKQKFNLDQYSYIKMINYIKKHNITAESLIKINQVLWNDDEYMKPVEVDPWLMFDIEELEKSHSDSNKISDAHKIESLERQLKEKDVHIEHLVDQISEMKKCFEAWIERCSETNGSKSDFSQLTHDLPENTEQTHVAKIPIKVDESYFMTYAHYGIHYEMLSDTVRTNSYREAILKNRDLFENKMVLDLGCGTSILSMFSSQAGAKKIIAVDQSEIIYHAIDIARKNKITNIEFVKGRLENMDLPLAKGEKVDILVSEWMGYLLHFECMLDSVIYARDNYLKPGGLLLPNRCTINLVAFGDVERHNEYIGFWKNVYGFDMGVLQSKVLREAIVETCRKEYILSDPVILSDLNMNEVDYTYPNFNYDFKLKIEKSGKFTAFVGYFDTFFDLPQGVNFSTGPHCKPTHWKQVVFYMKNPVSVNEGDIISGQFQCSRGKTDARALCVKIIAFDQELLFSLS
ncbi:protein arginine N-methyltransferase 1 [Contarinia nasturtii]|uniref:protein arginine N-methyltransferase 1 n=1 Tax=Contarinia nasturtii TaxID=265458 RepID=UPI0012D3E7E7|nr:protein arginine N-methyltransferase 1 [Contarinia nasturtii]